MAESVTDIRRGVTLLTVAVLLAGAGVGGYWLGNSKSATKPTVTPRVESHATRSKVPGAEAIAGEPPAVRLSPEAEAALGVELATVEPAPRNETLTLTGSLLLDSNRLAYVHSRFSGEVVSIGTIPSLAHEFAAKQGPRRPIRAGDVVKKGQLLAVVWSKEVGEKKSDLVDSLSRINMSRTTLERLESLEKGSVSMQIVREARRQFEADLIAVDRAERTLRSWRETDEEIQEVHKEAERIRSGGQPEEQRYRENWANVEIRAPLDGTLLENNVSLGEIIDTGMVLFKVADLSRMGVLANVYEEDLPKLTSLGPTQQAWQVRLKAEPEVAAIEGHFEVVGNVIDPGQHTAAVIGWIRNPGDKLRVGQFVTTEIKLPQTGWQSWLHGPLRPRSKEELVEEMNADLAEQIVGVDWNFSQYIRDNVLETLSRVKGENAIKIIGPDLDELERIAEQVKLRLNTVSGSFGLRGKRISNSPSIARNVLSGMSRSPMSRMCSPQLSAARL